MKQYTLSAPVKLGDKHPEYGQTFWSSVLEQDIPVMFNLMQGDVTDGTIVSAETVEIKTSKKGTEYHRLKKVKIEGGAPAPQTVPTPVSDVTKLDAIHGDVKLILSFIRQMQKAETPAKQMDAVIEDIGDGNITIDDLSGGHMTQAELDSIPF